ncbi:MAG: glycerol-3-phosphate acyltransferase, partial [Candidatus Neomarinimicrobiota bacterium]|nr:glycerol-3-phosphate acyltransferase [Candidatus Neomarinimicrobiota bacterium]
IISLFPSVFPFCILISIITLIMSCYVSLASIIASCSLPILLLVIPPFLNVYPAPLSIMIFSLLIPWFIIYTHRSNIQRIRNGDENQFKKAMIFRKD